MSIHSCIIIQDFGTEDILKPYIKYCFKINGRQMFIMHKKVNMLNSKIMKEK